jgi:HlyD family secretion protein
MRGRTLSPMVLLALAAMSACSRKEQPDAYGNVEATEVVVAAEVVGRLVSFDVTEGQQLSVDAVVGTIDATDLALERDQLTAQRGASTSRVNEVASQIDVLQAQRSAAAAQRDAARAQKAVLEAQRDVARRGYERTKRLFDQQAATAQQLDQAERDYRVLEQQLKAQDEQIAAQEHQVAAHTQQIEATRVQRQTAAEQVSSVDAQVARVNERIRKSHINNPAAGTVLATYARAGEFVQAGQPLYKIANLAAVDVRAYVAETQLAQVHVGSEADVTFDAGPSTRRTLQGKVTWVSSQAEFTPTPIQTRDERADLVYAVKIRVTNSDGVLKVGMPVDVRLAAARTP